MSICRAGCLLLLSLSVQAQEFYRWTDANGQLHVSQTPPPKSVQYEVLTLQQLSRQPLPKTAPHPKAATQPRTTPPAELDQQVDALNQRADQLQKELDAQRCQNAQRNKTALSRQAPVYQTDAQGQQVFLDDEQRAVQLELAEEEISRYCQTQ